MKCETDRESEGEKRFAIGDAKIISEHVPRQHENNNTETLFLAFTDQNRTHSKTIQTSKHQEKNVFAHFQLATAYGCEASLTILLNDILSSTVP